MSFRLSKSDTFRMPVNIESTDEKGRTVKETVTATYKRCDEVTLELLEGKRNSEVLSEVLTDVEGMLDEKGEHVPYEGDYRMALLSYPPATFALAAAFWQASRMGRAKN